MALDKDLPQEEYLEFRQDVPIAKMDYLFECVKKPRLYLMKEDPSTLPRAIRNMYVLAVLHYGLLALIWGTVAYWCLGYLRSCELFM